MDEQLRSALRAYLDRTLERQGLQQVVSSYDVWNVWQDADKEALALRPIIGELEQALIDASSEPAGEVALRQTARYLLQQYPSLPVQTVTTG